MSYIAVVGKDSNKLLAGHDKKMTQEHAEARCKKANEEAERLDIEARYKVAEVE